MFVCHVCVGVGVHSTMSCVYEHVCAWVRVGYVCMHACVCRCVYVYLRACIYDLAAGGFFFGEDICKLAPVGYVYPLITDHRVRPLNQQEICRGDKMTAQFPGDGALWVRPQ